jgi:hypothetical protein
MHFMASVASHSCIAKQPWTVDRRLSTNLPNVQVSDTTNLTGSTEVKFKKIPITI